MPIIEYDSYKQKLGALEPELQKLAAALDLDTVRREVEELEEKTADPNFWNDIAGSQKVLQRSKQLKNKLEQYERLTTQWEDLTTLVEMAIEEDDESLLPEIQESYDKLESSLAEANLATLLTGEQFPVQDVLYFDRKIDIAVIRISRTSTEGKTTSAFAALEMAGASEVYPGDDVYAIGNPLGDGISFSDGIVSDAARIMPEYALPSIVNTASISQGSSGGALLNAYGQVVGITTGAYVYGNNMYLAVPVDPAMDVDVTKTGWTMSQFYYDLPFLENN